ncbi:MAG TPA: extracellular solute-binding protein, partial [Candidatus Kapabacteria bacterium]|nr:extracellular solute-binding protein [Candidatus Kapabacteria bacterium]
MNSRGILSKCSYSFVVVAVLVIAGIAGCSGNGKTPLVVYSPHGKDLLDHFKQEFEAAHPAIDVEWLDMGSQDCLDRVRSERANPQADIWWGAPSSLFQQAADEGLLEPYAPSWKNATTPEEHGAHDEWYGTFLTPEVIGFNANMLTHDQAPKDWNELLEPKWKDSIVIREPLASGTMRTIFCALIQREARRTGSVDSG